MKIMVFHWHWQISVKFMAIWTLAGNVLYQLKVSFVSKWVKHLSYNLVSLSVRVRYSMKFCWKVGGYREQIYVRYNFCTSVWILYVLEHVVTIDVQLKRLFSWTVMWTSNDLYYAVWVTFYNYSYKYLPVQPLLVCHFFKILYSICKNQ